MKHILQRSDIFGGGGGGWFGSGRHPWYVLDDNRQPVPSDALTVNDFLVIEHCKPVGVSKTRVGRTGIPDYGQVSTVFLGLDHNWSGGTPILFECVAWFKPRGAREHNDIQLRCCTWTQAVDMHRRAVEALRRHGKELTRLYFTGDTRQRELLRTDVLTSLFDSLQLP